ncbi:hypothetical protein PAXRUDRAFT_722333 [Paxillus rubicundulus Ve08.2h10]|uniref:Uncharacterized protein n=1 Tax=Paxillus rubicundulus Ve08.2h10 TaxID=930991 RepID=A0A0D0E2B8_9AGAM|nr:hypothetical protein PAXRUDRAFT_722333 [Paxillus rubicundulus Ve08.2h10]
MQRELRLFWPCSSRRSRLMEKREIHSSAFLSGTCLALREAAGALSELSQRVIALRHAYLGGPYSTPVCGIHKDKH